MMSYELFADFIKWFVLNKDKFENFKMEKVYDEKANVTHYTITTKLSGLGHEGGAS